MCNIRLLTLADCEVRSGEVRYRSDGRRLDDGGGLRGFRSRNPAGTPGACSGGWAGGRRGQKGKQSAAVTTVKDQPYPYVDLRVDEHPDPIAELRRIYEVFKVQMLPFVEALPTRSKPKGDFGEEIRGSLIPADDLLQADGKTKENHLRLKTSRLRPEEAEEASRRSFPLLSTTLRGPDALRSPRLRSRIATSSTLTTGTVHSIAPLARHRLRRIGRASPSC